MHLYYLKGYCVLSELIFYHMSQHVRSKNILLVHSNVAYCHSNNYLISLNRLCTLMSNSSVEHILCYTFFNFFFGFFIFIFIFIYIGCLSFS